MGGEVAQRCQREHCALNAEGEHVDTISSDKMQFPSAFVYLGFHHILSLPASRFHIGISGQALKLEN